MSEKLQKILAQAGLGSRREMERWIEAGRVCVNHAMAKLGDRVDSEALIEVDGYPLKTPENTAAQPTVLMYHKPIGELCTRYDPEGRPTVFDQLPAPPSGRWIVVGRLDYNTSGLLLFTNDGELANQLMHPSFHLTRVYAVRVYGMVLDSVLDQLEQGVELEDGEAHFDSVESMGGDGRNHWYKVRVSMGRNRIVRRLWEAQSVKVSRLMRIEFGPLVLPRDLDAGKYRLLATDEVEKLKNSLGK
jgi:23S rRNA pseudouridine2605 synthase